MRETEHQRAQRQIEAALNGKVDTAGQRDLEAHLAACPTCQQIAVEMLAVENRLRSSLHARWDSSPALSERGVSHRAIDSFELNKRAKTMSKNMFNLASGAVAIAVLVLVIIFSISVLPGRSQPGAGVTATPQTAALSETPLPYPIDATPTLPPYPIDALPGTDPTESAGQVALAVKQPAWLPEGYVFDQTFTGPTGLSVSPGGPAACLRYYHKVYEFGPKLLLVESQPGAVTVETLQPPDKMQGMELKNQPIDIGGAEDGSGLLVSPALDPGPLCGSEQLIFGKALMFEAGGVQYVLFGHDVPEFAGYVSKLDLLRMGKSAFTGVSTIPADQVDREHLRSPEEAQAMAKFSVRLPAWVPGSASFSHGYIDEQGLNLILVYGDLSFTQALVSAAAGHSLADTKLNNPLEAYDEVTVWGQPAVYIQGAWTRQNETDPSVWDKSFAVEALVWEANSIFYRIQASLPVGTARDDLLRMAQAMAPEETTLPVPTGPLTYTVQAGDTLAQIAMSYNLRVESLLWANITEVSTISGTAEIDLGQVLQIPIECAAAPDRAGTDTLAWPLTPHELSGYDYDPAAGHNGIDIAGNEGDLVFAAGDGVVIYAGWNSGGYGNLVVIDHGNGLQTVYAHLSQISTTCGWAIAHGEPLGHVGATGSASAPLLHFEVIQDGQPVNPRDQLP